MDKNIVHIIAARPNFIKAAPVISLVKVIIFSFFDYNELAKKSRHRSEFALPNTCFGVPSSST